jgi:hypothetical protein
VSDGDGDGDDDDNDNDDTFFKNVVKFKRVSYTNRSDLHSWRS